MARRSCRSRRGFGAQLVFFYFSTIYIYNIITQRFECIISLRTCYGLLNIKCEGMKVFVFGGFPQHFFAHPLTLLFRAPKTDNSF